MSLNVLVVDDEPAMRELFTDLLEADGHRVTAYNDFPVIRPHGEFDRIILDLTLPSGSGWNWAATAAQWLGRTNRVIITTAGGDSGMAEIARREGYVFLMKPFRPENLTLALEQGA